VARMSLPRSGAASRPAATPAARPINSPIVDAPELLDPDRELIRTSPFQLSYIPNPLHELCRTRKQPSQTCLGAQVQLPSVVLELWGSAAESVLERRGQAIESSQALGVGLTPEVLKETERAPTCAIHAAVHALDVILVALPEGIDEGVSGRAHRAHANSDGEIFCPQCPSGDLRRLRLSRR
jgi:hypothetical protein